MADIPFLKNKNKKKNGGGVIVRHQNTDAGTDLMPHVTEELIEALHRKDIQAIHDALKALVLMIKDQDATD